MASLQQNANVSPGLTTRERLNLCAVILSTIDQNRERRKDPGLAQGIERQIVERELRELEADIAADPGPLELYIAKLRSEDQTAD